MTGKDNLWHWFGLGRASFLTMPRVLMHEMPDDWQDKMAGLLWEYDKAFPNQPDVTAYVSLKSGNKFCKIPEWMLNYRHPDRAKINELK